MNPSTIGRFDLTIDVPMPDMEGRKDILEHYFSKVKRDDTISIERIANITQGFTGAQLSNIGKWEKKNRKFK